jgi:two-component sensor histidine kinase/PAS domain-containing protein
LLRKYNGVQHAILNYAVLDTAPEKPFDDVVALAGMLCDTPTALVSLLDEDRQWFKARIGFACDQTDLDRSVCRHVVAEAETIIIPDLTADPRTSRNPLVTGDPHIRFYAGAPLATRFGVVGALCVIDTVPRPGGLTPRQKDGLERLARQVVELLEARLHNRELEQAIEARDLASAAERLSERRWRNLYHDMKQGFILGQVLRDQSGVIYDWRYEDVNPAWGELVGIKPDDARGRTIREVFPGIEDEWVMELASVVDTHEVVKFTRQVGVLQRWYDGTAQWVGGDDFTVFFHEVTDRIEAARRRDALLALGDMLRDETDIAVMTAEASAIIGTTLGVDRATYGEVDYDIETISVDVGWAAPGHKAIQGRYTFADYGAFACDLLKNRPVIITDVEVDTRTSGQIDNWQALGARAVVNMPVAERGRTIALLIVHCAEPREWSTDEIAFLRNAADRLEIAIARRRAEAQQDVLNGEIAHRLKNTLSMVQAIASQTLRHLDDDDAIDGFMNRLQALGTAHDALTAGHWQATPLEPVVQGVLDNLGITERCAVSGPTVKLGARAALSTSLLIHELATNAIKYGALSVLAGKVTVEWRVVGDDDQRVVLEWRESDGPDVIEPSRKGFGSKLIRLGLAGTGGAVIRYDKLGFVGSFEARLDDVEQA